MTGSAAQLIDPTNKYSGGPKELSVGGRRLTGVDTPNQGVIYCTTGLDKGPLVGGTKEYCFRDEDKDGTFDTMFKAAGPAKENIEVTSIGDDGEFVFSSLRPEKPLPEKLPYKLLDGLDGPPGQVALKWRFSTQKDTGKNTIIVWSVWGRWGRSEVTEGYIYSVLDAD